MSPIIEPVLDAARAHRGSAAEFRVRLPALFARMDDRALAELLRDLMFSGRTSGRADGA